MYYALWARTQKKIKKTGDKDVVLIYCQSKMVSVANNLCFKYNTLGYLKLRADY